MTLDFNEGYIEVDGDHDVLFVDNGSRLVSPRVIVPPDLRYTSTVIHYDTNRTSGSESEGAYDPNFDQHVDIEDLRIEAARYPEAEQTDSVALHLDARGSYIMFNRIDGRISGLGTQVLATTSGKDVVVNEGNTLNGYVNGNRLHVDLRAAQETHVRHAGVAGGSAMRSLIQGEIQPTSNVTEYGLVNETGNKTMFFRGIFWDAAQMNGAATVGGNITMALDGGHVIEPENFQEEPTTETTYFTSRDNVYGWFIRNGDGNSVGVQPNDSRSRIYTDESESLQLFGSGGVSPPPQYLSTVSEANRDHGALYRHDGSNGISTRGGTATTPGYYVWDRPKGEFVELVRLNG